MKGKLLTISLLLLTLCSLFSQSGTKVTASSGSTPPPTKEEQPSPQIELIDIRANLVYPYDVNDTLSVLCLVGDFAAHHNGAVITADSAVRYGDDRLECFGKVLINKNTTYAYADHADYNGALNMATLYSPMIKIVDEDVTLYTYNFTFNTLDNIGHYWGGGVTTKRASKSDESDVEMESKEGFYFADDKRVVGVTEVELRGEGYEMKGDSVIYEMTTERAFFFDNTNIWNKAGEYIYGDRGTYDKALDLYRVTKSAYMLTAEQEIWSDSMVYYRTQQEAILWENIQIDDTTHKSLSFGDYGQYWGDVERVLLTRNPSVINYDPNEVDSLFLRGDTIQLLSYPVGTGPIVDTAEIRRFNELKERMAKATLGVIEEGGTIEEELLEDVKELLAQDSTLVTGVEAEVEDEEAEGVVDSLAKEKKEKKEKREKKKRSFALLNKVLIFIQGDSTKKAERRAVYDAKYAKKSAEMEKKRLAEIDANKARDFRKLSERRDRLKAKIENRSAKGRNIYTDSMILLDVIRELESIYDTTAMVSITDSLAVIDSLRNLLASMTEEKLVDRDSLYRIVKVFRNVRTYRSDFQTVSDSMVGISYDTTLRFYIKPVIWAQSNQITADEVDVHTLEGNIDYADFFGDPIMSSEVISGDSIYYNQVKGKTMRVSFENNEVKRNDVDGNVQTIYYLEDDDTKLVNTIAKIESGSASFFIEDNDLDAITYRAQPTYVFAPLDKMPMDVKHFLEGFVWHADIRPTRNDIFDREIRPTLRMQKDTLPQPLFPISAEQSQRRKRLESRRVWMDRIEHVSPDVAEWMKELGFTPGEPREESPF